MIPGAWLVEIRSEPVEQTACPCVPLTDSEPQGKYREALEAMERSLVLR